MNIEKNIKDRTDRIVNSIRKKFESQGKQFSDNDEFMFRLGIVNGMMIYGSAILETEGMYDIIINNKQ